MANKSILNPTAQRIFAAWEKEGRAERPRNYLGASIVGHECEAYLWYCFRGVVRESFDGRMYRLFDRGRREEAVFCDDLRRLGCEVKDRDEKTGGQFAVTHFGGHFAGHLDAIARGFMEAPKTWHVCEFKTHSDASFRKLCKEGVKAAKPMHYAQMQTYMGLTGFDRAFYMAVDKDNDDLWCERIPFSKTDFDAIMARAKRIIDACEPERCATRPDDFRCKQCACRTLCWHESGEFVDPSVPVSCLTCCHSTAATDGEGAAWTCRLGKPCGRGMSCADHLFLPAFVGAEVRDGTKDAIRYSASDGREFVVGKGGFSSAEISRVSNGTLDAVLAAKRAIPGAVVEATNSIEAKFAQEDCTVVFEGSVEGLKEWCAENDYIDWAKPKMTETVGGKKYFNYADYVMVTIDGGKAVVKEMNPPF